MPSQALTRRTKHRVVRDVARWCCRGTGCSGPQGTANIPSIAPARMERCSMEKLMALKARGARGGRWSGSFPTAEEGALRGGNEVCAFRCHTRLSLNGNPTPPFPGASLHAEAPSLCAPSLGTLRSPYFCCKIGGRRGCGTALERPSMGTWRRGLVAGLEPSDWSGDLVTPRHASRLPKHPRDEEAPLPLATLPTSTAPGVRKHGRQERRVRVRLEAVSRLCRAVFGGSSWSPCSRVPPGMHYRQQRAAS